MDVKDSLTTAEPPVDTATRVAVISSLAALFLSGWSFLTTLDYDDDVRHLEQRLACLELPGPNDCGLDGR